MNDHSKNEWCHWYPFPTPELLHHLTECINILLNWEWVFKGHINGHFPTMHYSAGQYFNQPCDFLFLFNHYPERETIVHIWKWFVTNRLWILTCMSLFLRLPSQKASRHLLTVNMAFTRYTKASRHFFRKGTWFVSAISLMICRLKYTTRENKINALQSLIR